MEKKYNNTSFIQLIVIFFLLLILNSCELETGWESSPFTNYPYISKTVNGMKFEYYLLNENNKKSVVFLEGEGIRFCLFITNKNGSNVKLEEDMDIYRNDVGVFYLYDSNGILLGKPNTEINTPLVLRWFSSGEKYGREEVWPKDFSTNLNILQKGYYYTMFSKAFDFTGQRLDANTSKNTDTLTFRIDFQIK